MNDLLVVLVLGVIALGVYLIVDSLIGLFGKKKASDKKDQLIKVQKEYISTLEDGIKIRDKLIKTLALDILLLERRNGSEHNSDER